MRVAALYDIHGNLPALEAVLREVHDAAVDCIVVGGDVMPGPMSREALDCLLQLDIPVQFIRGNGESEILARMAGVETSAVPARFRAAMDWVARQFDSGHQQFLASWPLTLCLEVEGLGEVLFCHATPRNDTEIFTRETAEYRLLPIFENLEVKLVVCGHTHMQFDRMVGTTRVVNAGSVGMPYGVPGAYWLLLGPDVQARHTPYDLESAAHRLRSTRYPQVDEFIAHDLLQPRSEREILELFGRAELRATS